MANKAFNPLRHQSLLVRPCYLETSFNDGHAVTDFYGIYGVSNRYGIEVEDHLANRSTSRLALSQAHVWASQFGKDVRDCTKDNPVAITVRSAA